MKAIRLVLASLALVLGATQARAQATPATERPNRPRPESMVDIELTSAQKARLVEIRRKYDPELAALREEMRTGADRAEVMRKGAALRERSSADVRAILTPAQQAVFDRNVAEVKARVEQMRRQMPPAR